MEETGGEGVDIILLIEAHRKMSKFS